MSLSKRALIVVVIFAALNFVHSSEDSWFQIDDEDGTLTTPELISKYGYEVESHSVTTEDGYELTMFRILPQQPSETPKLPVLMVHGLESSAVDFIIIGPNNSFAYLLTDNGYDVWLANARGTRYSKKHSTLPVDSKEYWSFSWHEIGYYDLPAMIDYILNATSVSKLQYVGFSQGCTAYFVMATTRPEYNEKIALMTALSPPVIVKRVRSPLVLLLSEVLKEFRKVKASFKDFELLPYSNEYRTIAQAICTDDARGNICQKWISLIVGPDPDGYDQKVMTVYVGHTPAGASINQVIHYAQIAQSKTFQQFDYGRKENILRYGSKKPPVYDLRLATAPVMIYYALNDWLVHPRDVQELAKVLPRVVEAVLVADKQFNHLDFALAKNVRTLLYDQAIQVMEKFNEN